MTDKPNVLGLEAILRSLPIIYSYLKADEIPKPSFFFLNSRLYNYHNSKQQRSYKDTYETMKSVTPMEFTKQKELKELNELILLGNKIDILAPLLIPASEMDYFNELTEKEMIFHYKGIYTKKIKSERENQLISYILSRDHWQKTLYPYLATTKIKMSPKLGKMIEYIRSNYYQLKAGLYLTNYENYLRKNKLIK